MITTLTGPNSYMLKQELDKMVSKFVSEHSELGLERLDGEEVEYDRLRESLESMPFLADRKLVVIRKASANKEFTENAERLLSELPETTDVVLVEPKLDKRLAYYKLLKKTTNYKEFNELDVPQLSRWLTELVKAKGGSLSSANANLLINRSGINQQLLANEIAKLLNYQPDITKESILLLTEQTPRSTIFDLLDAALSGKTKQAIDIYQELRLQRVEPVQIIALLAWQLHVLALIKTGGSQSASDIASSAKLNPYVVRKSMNIAERLSLNELKTIIRNVRDLDTRLKSESIDPDEAMLHLLMEMADS